MARSMNWEEACFLDLYREQGIMQARINFYPRCPRYNAVLGLKPHSDGGFITIVLQDREVEGLQVLKEDQWFKVPIIPDALLINLGDQAEIMTNGAFKSPIHRVVTNSDKERISMALFCLPGPDTEIQPAQELITRDKKRRYKCVKNYLANYFFKNHQEGERPIDSVRL